MRLVFCVLLTTRFVDKKYVVGGKESLTYCFDDEYMPTNTYTSTNESFCIYMPARVHTRPTRTQTRVCARAHSTRANTRVPKCQCTHAHKRCAQAHMQHQCEGK